jgi:RHS repeat-associated protein
VVLVFTLLVTLGTPSGTSQPGRGRAASWSVAGLLDWLGLPSAWASPIWPATPRQETGTASGRPHLVSASATRAGQGAGRGPGQGIGELAAYQVPARTPRPTTTGTVGFDRATSQRVGSTATTDLYHNADGSLTRMVSSAPVNYHAPDGWHPIDERLSAGPDTRLHPAAAGGSAAPGSPAAGSAAAGSALAVADFAASAADPALVSLHLPGGAVLSYGLAGAAAVPASVGGTIGATGGGTVGAAGGGSDRASVTYPHILPATDLKLAALPGGMKESLVMHSAAAPDGWEFPLSLAGVSARLAGDGSVEFVNPAGLVVGRMPRGFARDARGVEAPVTYSLAASAGRIALRVSVDPGWLTAAARAFPVVVDPSYTSTAGGSTFVLSDESPGDYSYREDLRVGTANSGGEIANSFVQFPDVGTALAGHHISGVQLRLFDFYASSCTPTRFDVAAVTQAWPVTGNKNYPGPSFGTSIGNLTADPGAACTNTAPDPVNTVGTWLTVTLDPTTFTSWTTGGANDGLALYAATTGTTSYKRFDSVNAPNPPQLILTYVPNQAPQIDTMYPPTNFNATSLTPQLIALGHDPDNGPSPLTYDFTVSNSAGTAIADSGSISANNWVVPAGKLVWSQTYAWSVVAYDGADHSAGTNTSYFTTAVPQPLITSGLAQNAGDHGFDPSAGNYTTADVDAQIQTVGPALAVHRDYNSLDPRTAQSFGAGWSTVYDMQALNVLDPSSSLLGVIVTYPTGEEVEFGRNSDGTFSPPSGRYSVLTTQSTGYRLVDKSGTAYTFGQTTPVSGTYALSSIADYEGRTETFSYSGGRLATVTSASGRALRLTWATPAGASSAHVATVVTDPVTSGGSGLTWTYTYTGDELTGVCPPTSPSACTGYSYTDGSHYRTTVVDARPRDYWRLAEPAGGTDAADQMLINEGARDATYSATTMAGGAAGPLGNGSTAASFDGATAAVGLPNNLVTASTYLTVGLWFRTTATGAATLLATGTSPLGTANPSGAANPVLYVGTDGRLHGHFWNGAATGLTSTAGVNDGNWHYAVLSAAGSTQSLYLDGAQVGSALAGQISDLDPLTFVGAGVYNGNGWPAAPAGNTWNYFSGQIAEVAVYAHPVTASVVAQQLAAARTPATLLTGISLPSGRADATITYHTTDDTVSQVTDANGGTWQLGAPAVTGSSQVYVGAVLGSAPQDYWRFGETGASQAVDQIRGGTATYHAVTLGAAGVFGAGVDTAAAFNGTSSYVGLPGDLFTAQAASQELWFNTSSNGGVLFAAQNGQLASGTCPCQPALWITSDGRLRGLSPSSTPSGPLAATGLPNLCVDVAGGASTNGTVVDVSACTGAAQQNWTRHPDGTIRDYGKCLEATGGGTANGTKIDLSACTGAAGQVFTPTSGGLRNPASGRCLDDPSASTTAGTQLQLADCVYGASQSWIQSLVSAGVVDDGQWHHAVLVGNGLTQALYLDGALAQSSTGVEALAPLAVPYPYLGAGDTGSGATGLTGGVTAYFTGSMEEAAFYPTALTGADVARHYAAYRSAFGTAPNLTAPVQTVRVTDPAGSVTTYAFDPQNGNRPVSTTDFLGRTSYGYDVAGFLHTVTDPTGAVVTTGHDVRGNMVSQTTCQNQAADQCSTTYYTYYPDDTSPNPSWDPRNDMVLTVRDGRSSGPADNTYLTSYGYDAAGNRTTVTTPPVPGFPTGRTTTTSYSAASTYPAVDGGFAPAGLVATVTTPGAAVRTLTYLHNGDLARTVDPAGLATTYTYDGLGRVLTRSVVSDSYPAGLTTSYTYDGQGRPLTVTDPPDTDRVTGAVHTGRTTTTYDVDGNAVSVAVSDLTGGDATRTSTESYDSAGRVASATDAAGSTTTYGYDAFGHTTSETDPAGTVRYFAYDPDGHLLTTTLHGYTGDPANPTTPTDLVQSSRAYDPAGRLASVTDSMGWVTAYTYYDDGLLATVTRTDPNTGASTVAEADSYDAAGNLVGRKSNNATTSQGWSVDAAGRTTVTTLDPTGVDRATSYTYSPDDAVTSTSVYDNSGTPAMITDYRNDPLGRVTAQTVHNDTAGHPVLWWPTSDASGTTATDGEVAAPGTLSASGVTWAGGATFNATNGAIATAGPVLNTSADFTVSAWVDPAALTTAWQAFVIQQGSAQAGFHLEYDPTSGKWAFSRALSNSNGAAFVHAESSAKATAGGWTHLVGTYKASSGAMTLYVNGVAAGTATDTTPFNAGGPIVIGHGYHDSAPNNYVNAQIADVQVYSRTLSATDVSTLDSLGRLGSALMPVAGWWKLDGTAADSSGAGNAGTPTSSGVTWSTGLSFTGSPGDVSTPHAAVDTTADYSVGLWVNLASTGSAFQTLAVQEAVQQSGLLLEYDGSTGKWSFTRARTDTANPSFAHAESTSAAQAGVWTHLLGTYQASSGTMTLYVNGVANATNTDTTPIASAGPVALGHSWYNGAAISYASGQIANFQLYNRVLSGTDAATLFGYGRTGGALHADRYPTRSSLDQRGLATSQTDPAGNTTSYAYDEAGKLAVTTAPTVNAESGGAAPVALHPVSMTGYDTFGEPVESSDPNGNVTLAGYDAAGRPVSTTLPNYTPPGGTPITSVSRRAYTALGQLSTATDPLGNATSYTYDQLGDLSNVTDPAGGVTHYTYDTNGDQLSTVDPTGAQSQATYDYLGRTLTSTDLVRQPTAVAYTTTRSYADPAGYLASTTTAGGVITRYSYDAVGEPTSVTDGAGNTTSVTYDLAGRVVTRTSPDGTSTMVSYDQAGRQTATADRDTTGVILRTTSASYDAAGRPVAMTDPLGDTTTFGYDATGMLTGEVQPVSASSSITTSFGYDAAGNRTRFTDGRGNPFLTTYTAWNLPESTIEPATAAYPNPADRTFTVAYDAAGQVSTQTSPGGVVVASTYDSRGNLTTQSGSGAAAATVPHTFGYDAGGRLVSANAAAGTNTMTYDDRGLLLSASGPSGNSSFGYDADGHLTSRTDASGTSSYGYDTAGRLSTLTDAATGASITYGYTVDSQLASISYGPLQASRAYTYDSLHRLTSDTLTNPSGVAEASIAYGYDLAGHETSKTTTGVTGASTNAYTYDRAGRLTSWNNATTTVGYTYDASGNRTSAGSRSFTYDARNELTSDGVNAFTYTARGTLSSAGATASTSDAFNRVITDGTQTYTYDSFDRTLTAPGFTFAYSGIGNTPASDGVYTYSRGPGGDLVGVGTAGATSGAGNAALVLTDQHTDVVGQFTAAGAVLTGSATYNPLGTVTASAGLVGNLGYQSGWTDPVSAKVNMAARWYNPDIGQFTSRDTVANGPTPDSGNADRFAYVDDNPLTGTDPSGHCGIFDLGSCFQQAVSWVNQNVVQPVSSAISTGWNWVNQNVIQPAVTWTSQTIVKPLVTAAQSAGTWFVQNVVKPAAVWTKQNIVKPLQQASTWLNQKLTKLVVTVQHQSTQLAHRINDAKTSLTNLANRTGQNLNKSVSQFKKTTAGKIVTALVAPKVQDLQATWNFVNSPDFNATIQSTVAANFVWDNCEALLALATDGMGEVPLEPACGAVSGAVGGAMYYIQDTPIDKWTWSGLGKATGDGATWGTVFGFAGMLGERLGEALAPLAERLGTSLEQDGSALLQDAENACHSFDPATPVLLANGSSKPIGSVALGDTVESTDPTTGKSRTEPVVALHDNHDTDLADVTVQTSDGRTTTLHTTWHHPFWNETDHTWTDAAKLTPGKALHVLAAPGRAQAAKVVAVRTWTGLHDMRDLTVADLHTYYVLVGTTPVLVHNNGPLCYFAGSAKSRPDDLPIDENGMVHPPTPEQLAAKTVFGKSTFKSVEQVDAAVASKDQQIRLFKDIPEGVGWIEDGADVGGPNPDGHITLYPQEVMSKTAFDELLTNVGYDNTGRKTSGPR